jgi:hypothetical protein
MKTFIGVVIYVNMIAITVVLAGREYGPPIESGQGKLQEYLAYSECRRELPFKGIFWPIYWTYRFWDKVL